MALMLKSDLMMRRDKNRVILFSRRRSDFKDMYFLPPTTALILSLLDGKRSEQEVALILSVTFNSDVPRAVSAVDRITNRYRHLLIDADQPAPGRFDPQEFIFKQTGPLDRSTRLERPIDIAIVLLRSCSRRCRYCYVDAPFAANSQHLRERYLSVQQLIPVLEEARQIGVVTLTLAGGEPFLRPDILELLEYLQDTDFELEVSTKARLKADVVEQVARMPRLHLQVSLDSHKADICARLVGDKNYLADACTTLTLAREYGVTIETNTVLTSYNCDDIRGLVDMLVQYGVRRASFTPYYVRHFGRRAADLAPDAASLHKVRNTLRELQEDYGDQIRVTSEIESDNRPKELANSVSALHCTAGRTGFVILPGGEVTLCDRLPPTDTRFHIGHVPDQSLAEIWHSEQLHTFFAPTRQLFHGTRCFDCSLFDACNAHGRCYVESLQVYQRVFAPDRNCPLDNQG